MAAKTWFGRPPHEIILAIGGSLFLAIVLGLWIKFGIYDKIEHAKFRTREAGATAIVKFVAQAQIAYAADDHDDDGFLEFAPTLDVLEFQSLIDPDLLNADPSRDGAVPNRGYWIKLLKGYRLPNGTSAAYADAAGNLRTGYAVLVWPAEYNVTGKNSFICSRTGRVYKFDWGPATDSKARSMTEWDMPLEELLPPLK